MRKIIAVLAVALFIAADSEVTAQKKMVCKPVTATEMQNRRKSAPLYLYLKSVDSNNGSGVTRIGIDMKSLPSTSSRLDSATLVNNGKKFGAIDVDGVDFKRYFQWEESGNIYIELDFPRQKKIWKTAKVILHTVHGDYTLPLKNSRQKSGK